MSAKERRIAPRKACAVPLRFRILTSELVPAATRSLSGIREAGARGLLARLDTIEGETINLSERGIYFKSSKQLTVGEPLEMFFTIPRELTGRGPEDVRCNARVVHVDNGIDAHGALGIGAAIVRFEQTNHVHNWDN